MKSTAARRIVLRWVQRLVHNVKLKRLLDVEGLQYLSWLYKQLGHILRTFQKVTEKSSNRFKYLLLYNTKAIIKKIHMFAKGSG